MSSTRKHQNTNGFTIIEVALVLAIAGLIFAMVFIALPALRTSERDTERKNNISTFLDAVKEYQQNNRGALPTDWNAFAVEYLDLAIDQGTYENPDGNFFDPNGEYYNLVVVTCESGTDADCATSGDAKSALDSVVNNTFPNDYKLVIVKAGTCDGSTDDGSLVKGTANPRKIAIVYRLENSGIYCANS